MRLAITVLILVFAAMAATREVAAVESTAPPSATDQQDKELAAVEYALGLRLDRQYANF